MNYLKINNSHLLKLNEVIKTTLPKPNDCNVKCLYIDPGKFVLKISGCVPIDVEDKNNTFNVSIVVINTMDCGKNYDGWTVLVKNMDNLENNEFYLVLAKDYEEFNK